MVVPKYPFDINKFPDDDDILLDDDDLRRKDVVYCRKEILEQMKCSQWAKDEYVMSDMDPKNHKQWFEYHLHKCYTPYMDALGCVFTVADKEVQKLKRQAGLEGWDKIKAQFIHDAGKTAGETNAKMLWELSTNIKQVHEKTRKRDGHLFGERPPPTTTNSTTTTTTSTTDSNNNNNVVKRPGDIVEAMGLEHLMRKDVPTPKQSHIEVETMLAAMKEQQLKEQKIKAKEAEQKKSFWKFGF